MGAVPLAYKRNGDPAAIVRVLQAIEHARPDLRLHGVGLKSTALSLPHITGLRHTADPMAWSLAARKQGRNANDWRKAKRLAENTHARIRHQPA